MEQFNKDESRREDLIQITTEAVVCVNFSRNLTMVECKYSAKTYTYNIVLFMITDYEYSYLIKMIHNLYIITYI